MLRLKTKSECTIKSFVQCITGMSVLKRFKRSPTRTEGRGRSCIGIVWSTKDAVKMGFGVGTLSGIVHLCKGVEPLSHHQQGNDVRGRRTGRPRESEQKPRTRLQLSRQPWDRWWPKKYCRSPPGGRVNRNYEDRSEGRSHIVNDASAVRAKCPFTACDL